MDISVKIAPVYSFWQAVLECSDSSKWKIGKLAFLTITAGQKADWAPSI